MVVIQFNTANMRRSDQLSVSHPSA